jgi:hypothetical protein
LNFTSFTVAKDLPESFSLCDILLTHTYDMNAALSSVIATSGGGGSGAHHLPVLSSAEVSSIVGWISIWVWVCVYSPSVLNKRAHLSSTYVSDARAARSFFQSIARELRLEKR